MADVTDAAFRAIIAKYGKPDVMWTEFVSADGLMSKGREILLKDLKYSPAERPIVAQFFSGNPENMYKVALLAQELGFDGIDINMGCPDKGIEKSRAGASLIKNPKLAQEIIRETIRGAGSLPVSVKTRLGYAHDSLEDWLPQILETGVSAITIHARTRNEMSLVPARWERVKKAVEIRNRLDSSSNRTLILGNGDVSDLFEADARVKETGADGTMIGRGIFGNPWLFSRRTTPPTVVEKLGVLVEHTDLFEKLLPHKHFPIMKKHYKAYVNGFTGAKDLREKLMQAENAQEVRKIVESFLAEEQISG